MTEQHDDRQPQHGVRGASRTAHRESEESPQIARRNAGDPNSDREYLQDLPPADAESHDATAPDDGPVPAGHQGADSGSADPVSIDDETSRHTGPSDQGSQNDVPGVGPRTAEDD